MKNLLLYAVLGISTWNVMAFAQPQEPMKVDFDISDRSDSVEIVVKNTSRGAIAVFAEFHDPLLCWVKIRVRDTESELFLTDLDGAQDAFWSPCIRSSLSRVRLDTDENCEKDEHTEVLNVADSKRIVIPLARLLEGSGIELESVVSKTLAFSFKVTIRCKEPCSHYVYESDEIPVCQ